MSTVDSLELLRQFVAIPSPTGQEQQFAEHLAGYIQENLHPAYTNLQQMGDGRVNVIARRGNPRVTFTSHIDTVPTDVPVHGEGDRLYGTGACDAKGQIVAQLLAIQEAQRQGLGEFACFYVIGEEVNSSGAMKVVESPLVEGDFVLNGEPTEGRFIKRSKGVLELDISASGREQHTSIVPLDSAVHKLMAGMVALVDEEPLGSTVNVGRFEGGTAANVSAAEAHALVNMRLTEDPERVEAEVRRLLSGLRVSVESAIAPFDFYVPPGFLRDAVEVAFCSDAAFYAPNFEQGVMMYGPGSIEVAHTDSEHMDRKDLDEAVSVLTRLLLDPDMLRD